MPNMNRIETEQAIEKRRSSKMGQPALARLTNGPQLAGWKTRSELASTSKTGWRPTSKATYRWQALTQPSRIWTERHQRVDWRKPAPPAPQHPHNLWKCWPHSRTAALSFRWTNQSHATRLSNRRRTISHAFAHNSRTPAAVPSAPDSKIPSCSRGGCAQGSGRI